MTTEYKIRITEALSGTWFVEVIAPDGGAVQCKSGFISEDEAVDAGAELLKHHISERRNARITSTEIVEYAKRLAALHGQNNVAVWMGSIKENIRLYGDARTRIDIEEILAWPLRKEPTPSTPS